METDSQTASLSTFLVYALAIHPTIARQVRGEVRAVAGSDGQVDKDVVRDLKLGQELIPGPWLSSD